RRRREVEGAPAQPVAVPPTGGVVAAFDAARVSRAACSMPRTPGVQPLEGGMRFLQIALVAGSRVVAVLEGFVVGVPDVRRVREPVDEVPCAAAVALEISVPVTARVRHLPCLTRSWVQ